MYSDEELSLNDVRNVIWILFYMYHITVVTTKIYQFLQLYLIQTNLVKTALFSFSIKSNLKLLIITIDIFTLENQENYV